MKKRWIGAATGRNLCWLAVFCVISFWVLPVDAQTYQGADGQIIVKDDPGGNLADRLRVLQRLKQSRQPVEIRGKYCMSACTMYLGLPNTCISRKTTFGFHGPRSAIYGVGLTPAEFQKWSNIMADQYPEPLRKWYLRTGRSITMGFYEISGKRLIELGIAECL
ncbi:hypothetical protein [Parasulfitobacter algicola]|uniref:Uncharacterized protein n=1 Tax=Parasulfitobacter algicola TaxID=2614809 RepID=A0ABX2IRY9_9RHOB|nr:hypothetical protein [Sulfitobacter algicola]NSX53860.1 hypothetical protein [Sulfitobacter algicola]